MHFFFFEILILPIICDKCNSKDETILKKTEQMGY